ncbi:MAG: hypothetical protein Q9204_009054, partial [Flavoplaca sp. TL-2023a]
MASTLLDRWAKLSTQTLQTIISWFKATDHQLITKVIKTINIETIIRDPTITKAATLPLTPTNVMVSSTVKPIGTMLQTSTILPTNTMLPTSTLLLTSTTTTLASPSSQVAADASSVMDDSLFNLASWMSVIDLSSLGWLFLYFLAFLFVVSCLKCLCNHRQSIVAVPGLLRQFFTDIAGNRVRNIGIHVVGDVDFLVDETAGAMARMNHRSRRAMQASMEKTRRAAGRAGRYVSDNTRMARIRTVQMIRDPFFGGIIGVTVVYFVNFGVPVFGNKACKCGVPVDLANSSHDAQNLEH